MIEEVLKKEVTKRKTGKNFSDQRPVSINQQKDLLNSLPAACAHHLSKECNARQIPVRDALDILSGKWKIPIIVALIFGNYRFRELHRQIEGITTKMLSKELKELEMNYLIKRTVFDTTPVSVEYSITEHGKSIKPIVDELYTWGKFHRDYLHEQSRNEKKMLTK